VAGDLLVRDGMYEYRGLAMGRGTPYLIERVTGLFDTPDPKGEDFDRNDTHGDFPAPLLLNARYIEMEGRILGLPGINVEQVRKNLENALLPVDAHASFLFRRPVNEAWFYNVRTWKRNIPSDYALARGAGKFNVMFKANDPRRYGVEERVTTLTRTGTGTGVTNHNVINGGNWPSIPQLEINGPATNPRIKHNGQDRTIRVDIAIPDGSTLVIDIENRVVTLNGVVRDDAVRTDNQWWSLAPGANSITYTRNSGAASASTLVIRRRDVWM
jgi:hypothetical protein